MKLPHEATSAREHRAETPVEKRRIRPCVRVAPSRTACRTLPHAKAPVDIKCNDVDLMKAYSSGLLAQNCQALDQTSRSEGCDFGHRGGMCVSIRMSVNHQSC